MKSNNFVSVTYLIYIITWEAIVIGGGGYVVFWLHRSPLWFLVAMFLSFAAYSPAKWKELLNDQNTAQ